MKKNFKKNLIIILAIIGMVSSISSVFATTRYYSTISIGTGKRLIGSTRTYPAGDNYISIYIDSFTKTSGADYTKLRVYYYNDMGNYSTSVGSQTLKISEKGQLHVKDWGQLKAGNRYYSFSTQIDNVNHGGVKSNTVIMASI